MRNFSLLLLGLLEVFWGGDFDGCGYYVCDLFALGVRLLVGR